MHTSIRYFGLILFLAITGAASAQWTLPLSGCSIRYDYDAAGNRTSRYWYCWNEHTPGPAGITASSDSMLQKSADRSMDERVLDPLELHLFPNPASDQVNITLSSSIDGATYDIYDAQGRSVMQGKLQSNRLELAIDAIPPGLYNFCLVRGREMLVRPFVVER